MPYRNVVKMLMLLCLTLIVLLCPLNIFAAEVPVEIKLTESGEPLAVTPIVWTGDSPYIETPCYKVVITQAEAASIYFKCTNSEFVCYDNFSDENRKTLSTDNQLLLTLADFSINIDDWIYEFENNCSNWSVSPANKYYGISLTKKNAMDLSEYCLIFLEVQQKQASFTPTAKIAAADADKASIGEKSLTFLSDEKKNGVVYSRWKFSPTLNDGYELSYIQIGNDEKTRIYSEDGSTITWDITSNGEYTAYFGTAKLHATAFAATPVTQDSKVLNPVYPENQGISEGQSVGFFLKFSLPSKTVGKAILRISLYAGEGVSGTLFGSKEFEFDQLSPDNYGCGFRVDPLPGDLEKVTVAMQLNDGEVVTKTYPITVQKSGKTDLDFLSVPQTPEMRSSYPTNVKTSIGGPNIYDAVSFLDEATGELHLYLGGSGGVYKTDKDAATDLILMDGMRFPYRDNEHMSGYAFAVGGEDEDHLAALVYDGSNLKVNPIVCIYTCTDGVWSKVENSETSDYGRFFNRPRGKGLVIAADNIWTPKSHWNGTTWEANTVEFNYFGKCGTTYFAGSSDGIYRYTEKGWEKVSNTSGTMYVWSVSKTGEGYDVVCSDHPSYVSSIAPVVTVKGTEGTLSSVDASAALNAGTAEQRFISTAADGSLYTIVGARNYLNEGTSGYTGAALYKYVDGQWQHQLVDAFNDPNEDDNLDTKLRADGIRRIMSPCDNVTLFYGDAGAIYVQYAESTITFNTGSPDATEVAPITQKAGSRVEAPASPTLEGCTFAGWYTQPSCLSKYLYSFNTMPFSDITLYAKWVENGSGDTLDTVRSDALSRLEKEYGKYSSDEYAAKDWNTLSRAYKTAKKEIKAAEDYDSIQKALNTAITAMAAVEKTKEITVAVSIEKFIIDGTYIAEPRLVTVKAHSQASVVITDVLDQLYADVGTVEGGYNGHPYRLGPSSTITNAFYLASIYDPGYDPKIAGPNKDGKNVKEESFAQNYAGFLSEFDGGLQSGWMYCVNNSFPGVGASGWTMNNRDVMRWQFTCTGLGSDIGADNTSWGDGAPIPTANKDDLTWRVAEINGDKEAFFAEKEGNKEAYDAAMNALTNINSTQKEVDDALAGLGGLTLSEAEKFAKAVNTAIQDLTTYGKEEDYRDAEKELWKQYVEEGSDAIYDAETEEEIKAALAAAKAKIDTLKTLSDECEEMIRAIGTVDASEECKAKIDAARKFYDSLNSFQRFDVENYADLEAAEAAYAEALKEAGNKAKAQPVIDAIEAIGTVDASAECKAKIDAARAAYEELTYYQKTLVTNYDTLTEAEAQYLIVSTELPFTDVKDDDYFAKAVRWAVSNKVTNGTTETTFSPDAVCTRGQMVTFLWRAAGSPAPAAEACAFTDVKAGEYYYKAVIWAVEKGITNGVSATEFAPNDTVTRGQVATFLYRYAGEPEVNVSMPFSDVASGEYYYKAVLWAVANEITTGVSATEFAPKAGCTRGQIVTFLYRAR